MAYCLLGIFDINMPMLYGEGKKAFRRLQDEIIKQSSDLSIFAWDGGQAAVKTPQQPGETFINLFAESPSDFASCESLTLRSRPQARYYSFSMTSNCLILSEEGLLLDLLHGCYIHRIGYARRSGSGDERYLALKKVSSKMFVRVHYNLQAFSLACNELGSAHIIDVPIIPGITAADMEFITACNPKYIQLRSPHLDASAKLTATILGFCSQESWDGSRMTYLGDPDKSPLAGYIKLDGGLFERFSSTATPQGRRTTSLNSCHFYLVWEVRYTPQEPKGSLRAVLETKLYSDDEWAAADISRFDPRTPRSIHTFLNNASQPEVLQPHRRLPLSYGRVRVALGPLDDYEDLVADRFYIEISYEEDWMGVR